MTYEDYRKTLHDRRWGDWKYDADYDGLSWDRKGEYDEPVPEFGGVDSALVRIAHMNTKRYERRDMEDLAEAMSEILQCPGLASAHDTRYHTQRRSKDKVIKISGKACLSCVFRFECHTDSDLWREGSRQL